MAATYDTSLSTNKDHVRFLTGDTDVTPATDALLSDEEINAVITEVTDSLGYSGLSVKYAAAAHCLMALLARWMAKGDGVVEKQVSKLRIRRGSGIAWSSAIQSRIDELIALANHYQTPSPRVFKVL